MSVYIICSTHQVKHRKLRDDILVEKKLWIERNFGEGSALPGFEWRKLDLVKGGVCFAEMTGIKSMHLGQVFRNRHIIDLWWRVKDNIAPYEPGRGYTEGTWWSCYEYLRVSGEGGRAWRLLID